MTESQLRIKLESMTLSDSILSSIEAFIPSLKEEVWRLMASRPTDPRPRDKTQWIVCACDLFATARAATLSGWDQTRDSLTYSSQAMSPQLIEACRYRFESPYVHLKKTFVEFSESCFPPGEPLLLGVQALMEKIFSEFTFDAEATQVATPLVEVLERRRGVCQDFAHLMLACLRSRGLEGGQLGVKQEGRSRDLVLCVVVLLGHLGVRVVVVVGRGEHGSLGLDARSDEGVDSERVDLLIVVLGSRVRCGSLAVRSSSLLLQTDLLLLVLIARKGERAVWSAQIERRVARSRRGWSDVRADAGLRSLRGPRPCTGTSWEFPGPWSSL